MLEFEQFVWLTSIYSAFIGATPVDIDRSSMKSAKESHIDLQEIQNKSVYNLSFNYVIEICQYRNFVSVPVRYSSIRDVR